MLQRKARRDRGPQRPLAMYVSGLESGPVGLDNEAANPIVFVLNFRPDNSNVGDGAGYDPHFLAVQNVAVAVLARACAHGAGIGACIRLGQPEAAENFTQ